MDNNNAIVNPTAAILAEFAGGSSGEVEMMIGVGVIKESDAVFFQYLGDDQSPQALVNPTTAKPLTRLPNLELVGISVADDIGEFKSTKLNVYVKTLQGRTLMLTSGLTTLWSQCLMTCLSGLNNTEAGISQLFTLDSWKGNSKMRPCFSAIRAGREKVTDQELYDLLREARADRDSAKVQQLMRNTVQSLSDAINGTQEPITDVEVSDVTNPEELF